MRKMYNVLIIDDSTEYVLPLIERAADYNLNLEHVDNWEDAQKKVEKDSSFYKAIIIDGKGKLSANGKVEDIEHLTTAISWFKEQKGKGIHYNYFINSGFYEDIKGLYSKERIFGKLGDEERMFKEVLESIESLDSTKVEAKYPDVIEAFNDIYLPAYGKMLIMDLLISYDTKRIVNKPFNSIRDILEMICKKANSIDEELFPEVLLDKSKNNKPNLRSAEIFFSGREVDLRRNGGVGTIKSTMDPFPEPVNRTFSALVSICHTYSHDGEKKVINKYAFENALFGICELIVCFRNFLDATYEMDDLKTK